MPEIIVGSNVREGWLRGAKLVLRSTGGVSHLITVIGNPVQVDSDWCTRYSARRVKQGADTCRGVANVLFPNVTLNAAGSRESAYEAGWTLLSKARSRQIMNAGWGTYFERLTKFGAAGNQLETAINKINAWANASRTSLYFHTSGFHLDNFRTRGAPCLQYIQLECRNTGHIALTAVYRNHDFFNKAIGNFVGLGRLLAFICKHTEYAPAELTCISMHAYADVKRDLSELVGDDNE